jgi:hypothetical protein
MPDVSDNTNWFELDSANITAPPNGWPEGQAPSTVNDCARSNMGALKRFWNRINGPNAIAPAAGVYTLATSNTSFPTAYVDGEVYKIRPGGPSVGGDQFKINALAAKPIWKVNAAGTGIAIAAGDMVTNQPALLAYNSAANGGSGAFFLINPLSGRFGVTDGSNAAAGQVGEYAEMILAQGSAIGIGNGIWSGLITLGLTAGDWDVWAEAGFLAGSTCPLTLVSSAIALTTPPPSAPGSNAGQVLIPFPGNTAGQLAPMLSVPVARFNFTASTGVILSNYAAFSAGTCNHYGAIRARRVR